jgi:hypothetical protein
MSRSTSASPRCERRPDQHGKPGERSVGRDLGGLGGVVVGDDDGIGAPADASERQRAHLCQRREFLGVAQSGRGDADELHAVGVGRRE